MASYAEVAARGIRKSTVTSVTSVTSVTAAHDKDLYDKAEMMMRLLSHSIPPSANGFDARLFYTQYYSYVIMTPELVRAIAHIVAAAKGPTIEVLAGTGLLTYFVNNELYKKGVSTRVQASDLFFDTPNRRFFGKEADAAPCGVLTMDAIEHIRTVKPTVVIMSWPPYGSDLALRVVQEMVNQSKERISSYDPTGVGSTTLIYMGEGYWGCCADDAFFQLVEQFESDNQVVLDSGEVFDYKKYISWRGYGDHLTVYHLDRPKSKTVSKK
jgi:hypothetical protein